MSVALALILFGCNNKMSGMPKYESKECYYGDGFQDYTDYCKYYYTESTIKNFETSKKFKKVLDSDIEEIKSYFKDFEEWVKSTDYYEKYDFVYQTQVKDGDYFYIYEKPGYEKYGNYDLYYVDMDKLILYFIHSNI
jgi:hypothetical protein